MSDFAPSDKGAVVVCFVQAIGTYLIRFSVAGLITEREEVSPRRLGTKNLALFMPVGKNKLKAAIEAWNKFVSIDRLIKRNRASAKKGQNA